MEITEEIHEILKEIKNILQDVEKNPNNMNYWGAYKKIRRLDFSNIKIPESHKVKIALLSSFTIEPLGIYLDIECRMLNLFPEIYIGGFNQFWQEVYDSKSALYEFNPAVTIFAVQLSDYIEDLNRKIFELEKNEKLRLIENLMIKIKGLVDEFNKNHSGMLLINNFIVPTYSSSGILDNKLEIGIKEFYQLANENLSTTFRPYKNVYIFDLDNSAAKFGKNEIINNKMHYMGSMEFSESFLPFLIRDYMSYFKAFKGLTKKCIVLDLDNTLWGGIIGEDGINGIKIDNTFPGNQFLDFQKFLLELNKRGVILAINSKNNYDDVIEVFRKHPFMVLKEENFGSLKINWNDKVSNLIEIAKEIGIGLDSIIYIDDSPAERELVRQALPEVLVINLPKSPSLYKKTLESLNDFDSLALTEEDTNRWKMYYTKRKRKELEETSKNFEDYLKKLEIEVEIKELDDFAIPRVANLIKKTNQFNLTTKRYSQEEIDEMRKEKSGIIYYLREKDIFGDEGIVGVAIIKKMNETWFIDSFLMSCRIIGRGIETAFISKIINDAKSKSLSFIEGEYIKTKKNELVNNFYKNLGFQLLEDKQDRSTWILSINNTQIECPKHIRIKV